MRENKGIRDSKTPEKGDFSVIFALFWEHGTSTKDFSDSLLDEVFAPYGLDTFPATKGCQ